MAVGAFGTVMPHMKMMSCSAGRSLRSIPLRPVGRHIVALEDMRHRCWWPRTRQRFESMRDAERFFVPAKQKLSRVLLRVSPVADRIVYCCRVWCDFAVNHLRCEVERP